MPEGAHHNQAAEALVSALGIRARQAVVDEIVIAIRAHDLTRAKQWDQVGRLVDEKLARAA
jgi:hypothetical protein